MTAFFRFPHMPHLLWLGEGKPRDDKVLTATEVAALLAGEVVVEEKLDGANLGLSAGEDGRIRLQNRGQYLVPPFTGQFSKANAWLPLYEDRLAVAVDPDLIIFGEWCAARHSVPYDWLPNRLLVFDVYQRNEKKFWSAIRRDALAAQIGLPTVPRLHAGTATVAELRSRVMTSQSRYGAAPAEGIVIRREDKDWSIARAKLVRPGFTQGIGEHWSRRAIEWNKIARP